MRCSKAYREAIWPKTKFLFFPIPYFAWNNVKQRMRFRQYDALKLTSQLGCSYPQLGLQMCPLKQQLPAGLGNRSSEAAAQNFGSVKMVAAAQCFRFQTAKKRRDGAKRIWRRLKTHELRMVAITFGCTCEHLLGEQCLPPGRNKPFWVQVARMQGP